MENEIILDLYGLIGKDIDLYNRIIDDYYNEILKINNINNIIKCNITIDKINLYNTYNCNVNLINQCHSNSKLSLKILFNVIVKNKKKMSEKIKNKIQSKLKLDLDKKFEEQNKNNIFIKKCSILVTNNQDIVINNLSIKNCYSTGNPLFINFINTGDASSNCGFNELFNSISESNDNKKNNVYFLNKIFNLNLYNLIYIYIFMILLILLLLIFFFSFYKKKYLLRYKYKIK